MPSSRCVGLWCSAVFLAALVEAASGLAGEAAGDKPGPDSRPVMKIYDIQELTRQVPDFPGPELSMMPFGAGGPSDAPVYAPFTPTTTVTTCVTIVDIIKNRIEPESWQPGKGTDIQERQGTLVVIQTPQHHRQIEALLRALREQNVKPLAVQAMVLAVDAGTAAKLRLRRSREFEPKEVEELVKSAGAAGLLASSQVSCANGQRNHNWTGRRSSFVSGYTAAGERADPCVSQLLEGAVLDVRPTLSFDGSVADVELRLTVADDRRDRKQEIFLSIEDSGAKAPPEGAEAGGKDRSARASGAAQPRIWTGEVRLPSTRYLRFRGSVTAPLGRHVLAGMLLMPDAQTDAKAAGRTAVALLKVSRPPAPEGVARAEAEFPAAGNGLVQGTYDVRELTTPHPNWPGPILSLVAGGGGAGAHSGLAPVVELPAIPPGGLQDMIKRVIEPQAWGVDGTSIQEQNGQLIVFHKPAVQERIRQLLVSVRRDRKPQLAIQGLALAVSDKTAARLRQTNAAEFSPEEAEELLKEAGEGALLAEQHLLCYNAQRVGIASGRQTAYVAGFTSTGANVTTPSVNAVFGGSSFDVRPVLSADRRTVTVDLRCTVMASVQWKEDPAILGTIPGPGGAAPRTVSNKVSVPQEEFYTVRGESTAPLGKYVLAGTFRRSGEAAKAAPNVLVLVKAEVCPPAGDRPARPE